MTILEYLVQLANDLDTAGKHSLANQIDNLLKYAAKTSNDLIQKRFWSKVKKIPNGCWIWTGAHTSRGYGICTINKKLHSAHRLSYEWANNTKIPKGYVLLHSCDVRSCCRPSHLSIGTTQENAQDRVNKDRSAKGKDNGMVKLKKKDIKRIKKLHTQGWTETEIAQLYEVSRGAINHILHQRTWRWLE
jgi:hypothetical protein